MRSMPASQGHTYPWLTDRAILLCATIYLSAGMIEGPLRFALASVGALSFLYVRDLLALTPPLVAIIAWARGYSVGAPVAAVFGMLLVHLMIGVLTLSDYAQIGMGFKMFLPMLLGLGVAPVLVRYPQYLIRYCLIALLVTSIGVLVNVVYEWPWIGASYETAFGEKSGGKEWYTGDEGEARLAGFTRSSVNAASIVLMCLPVLTWSGLPVLLRLVCALLGVAAIVKTTSKGPLVAVFFFSVQAILMGKLKSKLLSGTFIAAIAIIALVTPLTLVYNPPRRDSLPSGLGSFMDRIDDEWPRALALLEHEGHVLWGRGLGGIGTPQSIGEPWRWNSGDNVMMYMLVVFGVFGPLYIAVYIYNLSRRTGERPHDDFGLRVLHGWSAAWLADGIVSNMYEDPVTGAVMGVMLGTVLAVRPRIRLPFAAPRPQRVTSVTQPP